MDEVLDKTFHKDTVMFDMTSFASLEMALTDIVITTQTIRGQSLINRTNTNVKQSHGIRMCCMNITDGIGNVHWRSSLMISTGTCWTKMKWFTVFSATLWQPKI